eukprot:6999863-Lingulodinium_polyedra.AAC.1
MMLPEPRQLGHACRTERLCFRDARADPNTLRGTYAGMADDTLAGRAQNRTRRCCTSRQPPQR